MELYIKRLFCLLSIICCVSFAQATTYTGRIGTVQWTLDTESGILTLYGTGDMANYHGSWNYGNRGSAPWYNYRTYVKSVVIEDGVTSIGAAAFYRCSNLTEISIPPSLTKIGYEAFRGCTNLEEITIGSGVCTIQDRWVTDCPNLKYISVEEGNTCFVSIDGIIYTADMSVIVKMPDDNPITMYVIPDGVSSMATDAVYSQQNVESITVPVSMTNIDYGVFDNCPKLTTLIFKADTPPTLAKELSGTSLQFIYVPCDAGSSYTGASGNWGSYSDATGGFSESPVITLNTATNNTELGVVTTTQQADCENYLAQVTAEPTEHGIFDHWEADGNGSTDVSIEFPVEVNGEYNYTAIFNPKQYTISTAQGTKRVNYRDVTSYYTVNGAGTYYYGDTIEISVSITSGHGLKFSSWTDGNNENPRRVRVTGNKTYTATVASGKQQITIKSNDANMGTVTYTPQASQNRYDFGTQIVATATPKNGYHFSYWSDGCTTTNDTIIAEGDATYVAFFAINTYKITAVPNDAVMGTCSGYGTFKNGASTTLEATPNTGYRFVQWNDGVTDRERTLSNISADADYIAEFEPIPYTITVISSDEDKGTVSGSGTYDYNTDAAISAVPKNGYHFVNWEDDINAPAERDVLVLGDATYTATFGVNSYAITATSANSSYGTVTGGGTYDYNASVTLTATPKTGYHFVEWNDGNTSASRSITVVGDASYEATFAINQYTIVFKDDDGTQLQSTLYDYLATPSCDEPTKTATAQYTYTFSNWTPAVASVTADAIYTAVYNSTVNTCSVIFKNDDGTVLQNTLVAYGEKPVYSGATPEKSATAQYTYSFAGWNTPIVNVTGEAVYTASYNSTVNQYTIGFKNGDVTLQSSKVAYGAMPVYYGETPTKSSTAQYSYTFDSWSPALASVTADATYNASFTETVREYVVTFKNENGTELQSSSVKYGVTPVYSGETPTKAATAEHTYTFRGWNKEIVPVTGAAVYTAVFDASLNTYAITFLNDDNSVIATEDFEYGAIPTCESPTKPATAQYSYTFNGWSPAVVAVTQAATYKATYTSSVNTYTVTFKNDDGTVLQTGSIEYGETPTYVGATPTKSATAQYTYTFNDWDSEIAAVTGDVTYVATYTGTVNTYAVTFKNEDGTVLQTGNVEYGKTPVYSGETPTKSATAQYTYTFDGWSKAIEPVTEATVYTATYASSVNTYAVVFKNEDGAVLQSSNVVYGTVPVYSGETPTKESSAQYSYTFAGWNATLVAVVGAAEYVAVYTPHVNTYWVTFFDEDGVSVLDKTEYSYGETPSCEIPTKAATAQYTYSFDAWTPAIASVTGTASYRAQYTATTNSYLVKFVDEDGSKVLQSMTLEYGSTPEYTEENPTKSPTAQYTYTFAGWDKTIVAVTEPAVYTATYSETLNNYTITFVDDDLSKIKEETYAYGVTPSCEEPSKAATAQYTYEFSAWSPSIAAVTGNATYTATYNAIENTYTVTFKNEDGTVLQTLENVVYGVIPTYSAETPQKEATAQYSYNFKGWNKTIVAVTEDVEYVATYVAVTNSYTVTFKNYDGTVLQSSEVQYGVIPSYSGAMPTKPTDGANTYSFAGWDVAPVAVVADAVYTATFSNETNKYVITFYDADGTTILQDEEFVYGATPICPVPVKEATAEFSYTFDGWNPAVETVTGTASYVATYKATKNVYDVDFVDEDGITVLQSSEYEYGATPTYAGATPTKASTDQYSYTFAGWNSELEAVTGNTTYTAVYTPSLREYVIIFKDEDGTELQHSLVKYGEIPTCETPTKAATAQYIYSFAAWSPALEQVSGNATYTATYSSQVQTYTVTFKNDNDVVLQTIADVAYGTTPTYSGEIPTKAATAQYTYSFDGWNKTIVPVSADVTYTATYSSTVNNYTITFYDEDGVTVLQNSDFSYGATPMYSGTKPEKIATAQYTYQFDSWSPALQPVTGATSYKATYSSAVNSYTVTFYDEDGTTVLQSKEYEYGITPEYTGITPTKSATSQYSYSFDGWNTDIVPVTGTTSYKATYAPVTNSYVVRFENEDGTELQRTLVEYGAIPVYNGDEPEKSATAQYSYEFAGWNTPLVAVTENVTYVATFNAEVNSYTVTFKNYDGTVLQTVTLEYGETPVYTEAEPSRPATSQYTYVFQSWDKTIVAVNSDAIYVAEYTETVNSYTVTFTNYDGAVLQETEYEYGVVPSYAGETPTRPSEAGKNYSFVGWNIPIAPVSGDVEYIATYTDASTTYMISFFDEDGTTLLGSSEVAYGKVPSFDAPSKAADAQYTYTFDSWYPALHAVDGPESYVATYSSVKNTYRVTFVDEDGETELSSKLYEYGIMPSCAVPTKQADAQYTYEFSGWNTPIVAVTSEATYTATYSSELNQYQIVFLNDNGQKLSSADYEYGVLPSCGQPSKESTPQYTYEFDAWTPAIATVTADATYTATYSQTVNSYEVTFKNEDGSLLQNVEVAYGELPVYAGEQPTKSATKQYTYEFAGWNKTIVAVTGPESYVATYSSMVNTYTITFKNSDGEVLQSSEFAYGVIPSYNEAIPTKPGDDEFAYSFAGWNKTVAPVIQDMEYKAVYTKTTNVYAITFKNYNDTVLQTTEFSYGALPTCPIPTRNADEQYTYVFLAWSPELSAVASDAEYVATYNSIPQKYMVTFVDDDGTTVLQAKEYEYGKTPIYSGTTPTKPETAQYSYQFNGWDKSVGKVTGAVTYRATYAETERQYTVTFVDDDFSVLASSQYTYGGMPTCAVPEKTADAHYSYVFQTWKPALSEVVSDVTYQAVYEQSEKSYNVVFSNYDGTELQNTKVAYGAYPEFVGEIPEKSSTAQYSYDFSGWDKPIESVSGNVVYTAIYSEKLNEYTVVFKNYNGEILQLSRVEYGALPSYDGEIPTKPTIDGVAYSFAGWDMVPTNVVENVVYTATYLEATTMYEITFVDDDGTELQKTKFAYGAMPICANPSKESTAQYSYSFESWYPKPTVVTSDKTYTAVYKSVVNSYVVTFVDDDGETVLQSSEYEYGDMPSCMVPSKESTAQYSYSFAGWNYDVIPVTGNATYTATYDKTVRSYPVTFLHDDDSKFYAAEYEYGSMPEVETPTKESTVQYNYLFAGWMPAITKVNGSTSYKATYTAETRKYAVSFVDEDGTELQKTTELYGAYPEYVGEAPTKASTAQYSYSFSGWDKTIVAVSGDAVYTASYTKTVNTYSVSFLNEDGTVLQSSMVEYGVVPSYEQSLPTKEADEEHSYSFAGWNNPVVAVEADAEYIATFTDETNFYQITFRNSNDQILQRSDFAYGSIPTCPIPTQKPDAQYSYEFESWFPDVVPVDRATTYYAVYKNILNTYTVQFVDDEGTVLAGSGEYEYGAMPESPKPTKASTENYSYVFTGWDKTVETVSCDIVYTAVFTPVVNSYMITFESEDGQSLACSGEYPYGALPSCVAPVKPADAQYSYVFKEWTPALTSVKGTATYRPLYDSQVNTYSISFVNEDGSELQISDVAYGSVPTYLGAIPSKEGTDAVSYSFAGWDKSIVPVTSDAVYTAQFTESKNSYLIVFQNEDGTILQKSTVEYGVMPSFNGTVPTKPNDVGNVYAFAGWNVTPVKVVADAVYIATYMIASDMYMITFEDEDGTILQQQEFTYRSIPTCPIPTKLADAQYSYLFEAWSPDVQPVTKSATYVATYSKTPQSYVVDFVSEDNSVILYRKQFDYGEMPEFQGDVPQKARTPQYSYEFCCWSPELKPVDGAATYMVSYNAIVNQYVVSFKNEDGTVLQLSSLRYGDMPVYGGDVPTKSSDASSEYVFSGWDHEISMVTGTDVYVAQYTASAKKYTVEASPNDVTYGTVEGAGSYEYNSSVELTAVPNYGYNFLRWSDGNAENPRTLHITKNYQLEALFEPMKFGISIVLNNNNYGYVEGGYDLYEYGTEVTVNAIANEGYEFANWSDGSKKTEKVFVMNEDKVDTAFFKPKTCIVTSMVNDILMGTVSGVGSYGYNTMVTLLATPREGFEFVKWNDGNINATRKFVITSDTSFEAMFRPIQYVVTLTVNDENAGTVVGSGTYDIFTDTVIEAKPNYGYEFIGWSDGVVDMSRRVVVVADTTYRAEFKPMTFDISVYSNDDSMGEVQGAGAYDYGTEVSISAIPQKGYRFESWSDGDTIAERTYKVSAKATLIATFVPIQYEVRLSVNDSYCGAVSGGGFYNYQTDVELVATPTYGHKLQSWSNGATTDTITVVVLTDTLLIANFVPEKYKLTLGKNIEEAGIVSGGGSFEYMDVAVFSVVTNEGYEFLGWSDGSTDTVRNVMITKDMDLTAKFQKIENKNLAIYSKPNYIMLKYVRDYTIYIINPLGEIAHYTEQSPDDFVEYYMHTKGVYIVKVISPEGGVTVQKVLVR